jgi:diphthamide biosynthesis enzyme Dph1/Dph2-like protein
MPYKLELDKTVQEIKDREATQVLVQLPDGLKTKAQEVVDHIESNTQAKAFIFFGNCFGACDLPLGLDILKIDLMIQFGHNRFHKEEW